jgi:squalene synthase HpnC
MSFSLIRPPGGWCEGWDSNPQASRRWNLNPVRLPIPPPSPGAGGTSSGCHYTADLHGPRGAKARISLSNQRLSSGHYENFPVASWLLPRPLRAPVAVIYRFARGADDIADEGDAAPDERLAQLAAYAAELDRIEAGAEPRTPLFGEVAQIVRRHGLPTAPFRDLLSAFAQDVVRQRYRDYAELLDYCRRSANPVGRLLLQLFGRTEPAALARSDAICTSLQLINFWQDIALDWAKGRLYLPQEDLRRFGVAERHIAEQICNDAWRALMRHQCERAQRMMLDGAPLARTLRGRVALEIGVTIQGGLRILEKLARCGYDMFRHRPVMRAPDWPLLVWRAL